MKRIRDAQTILGTLEDGKAIQALSKELVAAEFIRANKTLANAFSNGAPEVSVFWTNEAGIRFKARFDYLKRNAIVDLKSVANLHGKSFERACHDALASYDYILSGAHYTKGRLEMARLLAKGALFNEASEERALVEECVKVEDFSFVFVFYQKTGAPISYAVQLSQTNPLMGYAHQMILTAIENYKQYMDEFGTTKPWVPTTDLIELDETHLPQWYRSQLTYGA